MPRVSIIIPTYNRSDTISRAVRSAMEQSISDIEIIVIDDNSSDNTSDVISRFNDSRIKYVKHQTNHGGGAARNTGIKIATGDYIAFLDSDDEWHPLKLEKQIKDIEARSDTWVANYCGFNRVFQSRIPRIRSDISDIIFFDGESEYSREGDEEIITDILTMDVNIGGSSTLLVKREAVEEIGGFDEQFPRHQDWEFLIRLLKKGKLSHVNEPLVTKYESGAPSVEAEESAKQLFIAKFESEIKCLESSGIDVHNIHYQYLMRAFFREGKLSKGFEYMNKSGGPLVVGDNSGVYDITIIFWCIIVGLLKFIIDRLYQY
jgi:glycosyltransferase involved in cell wall biosynthesis